MDAQGTEVYCQQRKGIFYGKLCCSDSCVADESSLLGCDAVWLGES